MSKQPFYYIENPLYHSIEEHLKAALLVYLSEHGEEILTAVRAWREAHGGDPNVLIVPDVFAQIAYGARFYGLDLVTPVFEDDDPSKLPRVTRTAVPAGRLTRYDFTSDASGAEHGGQHGQGEDGTAPEDGARRDDGNRDPPDGQG